MSHTAMIKIAPVLTAERLNDPTWNRPGRTLYYSDALKFLPSKESVPLLVDHDEGREIGRVHELFKMQWTDGPWICARVTVDAPPYWLKRGTRASFAFLPLQRCDYTMLGAESEVMANTIVTEVSVLSHVKEPAEPRAEVLLFERSSPPAVPTSSDRAAGGEVPRGLSDARIEELQAAERRKHYAAARAKQGVVVRHGVGQVLGVR